MPLSVDNSAFHRRQRAMIAERKRARVEALQAAAHELGDRVRDSAPRDTNRYVRGAMMAFNQAGAGPFIEPNVEQSVNEHSGSVVRRLKRQVVKMERELDQRERLLAFWYAKGPPRRPRTDTYRRLQRERRFYEKRARRAKEELAKATGSFGVIVIGGRRGKRGVGLTTVRTKIYGGRGRTYTIGPKAVVELVIMEPHATFVERRYRVFREGERALRSIGLRRASRTYLRRMQAASG